MRPQAVYIDWPFFYLKKFPLCTERYARTLCMEMSQMPIDENRHVEVLYIGGGGVNFMPGQVGLDISDKLRELYSFSTIQEGTIEIAHGLFELEHLDIWHLVGINRVVIRIDTINQLKISMDYLQKLPHTLALDCSIALTQETSVCWQQFLHAACAAWPFKQIAVSSLSGSCQRIVDDFYRWLQEHCMSIGMHQYELYSFAYPGYESRYMQAIGNHKILKGFGVGAESYDGVTRTQNTRSVKKYIGSMENNQTPVRASHSLTVQQKKVERLLMGLRAVAGVPDHVLYEGLNEQQRRFLAKQIKLLECHKLIMQQNGRIILAPNGRGYEDDIVLQLTVY